ncbi:unnamed protein product [Linum tenue]|uniref:Uncharacterized protein n=1 Tax=Linum tenue TaxID=586396 RepID=A0AAV0KLN7_9ROSI|nr:unnamed protein product [Linum tenue]
MRRLCWRRMLGVGRRRRGRGWLTLWWGTWWLILRGKSC